MIWTLRICFFAVKFQRRIHSLSVQNLNTFVEIVTTTGCPAFPTRVSLLKTLIDIIRYVCKFPNSQSLESFFFVSKCRLIYIRSELNSRVYWIGKINIEANKVYSHTCRNAQKLESLLLIIGCSISINYSLCVWSIFPQKFVTANLYYIISPFSILIFNRIICFDNFCRFYHTSTAAKLFANHIFQFSGMKNSWIYMTFYNK